MDEIIMEQRITKVEESVKSAHLRINQIESMQREIRDLTLSVNTLAGSVGRLCTDVNDQGTRLDNIENRPGQKWDKIVDMVTGAAVGGVIAFLLSQLLR